MNNVSSSAFDCRDAAATMTHPARKYRGGGGPESPWVVMGIYYGVPNLFRPKRRPLGKRKELQHSQILAELHRLPSLLLTYSENRARVVASRTPLNGLRANRGPDLVVHRHGRLTSASSRYPADKSPASDPSSTRHPTNVFLLAEVQQMGMVAPGISAVGLIASRRVLARSTGRVQPTMGRRVCISRTTHPSPSSAVEGKPIGRLGAGATRPQPGVR